MNKILGLATVLTLCLAGGAAVAKNSDGSVNDNVVIGSSQTASTASFVAIAQPIEGDYSSTTAIKIGASDSRSIIGHGSSIIGHGSSIIGHGSSIIGHGSSIIGHGSSIIGHGSSIIGHGSSIIGHGSSIIGHGQ